MYGTTVGDLLSAKAVRSRARFTLLCNCCGAGISPWAMRGKCGPCEGSAPTAHTQRAVRDCAHRTATPDLAQVRYLARRATYPAPD